MINLGANATLGPQENNETISATSGDTIWLGDVAGDAFTGAGFTVNAGNGASFSVGGNAGGAVDTVGASNAAISVLDNANVVVWGTRDVITAGSGSTIQDADGGTVNVGAATGVTITGGNVNVNASQGANFSMGGAGDNVETSGATIHVLANSNVQIWGSNDTIVSAGGSNFAPSGANETVTAGPGDNIWLGAVTGDVITGAGYSVHVGAGTSVTVGDSGGASASIGGASATIAVEAGSNITLWGSNYQVGLAANVTLGAQGNNETITATAGDNIWLGAVTGDAITGAGFTVNVTNGTSLSLGGGGVSGAVDTAAGSGASISLLANSNAALWGDGEVVGSQGHSAYVLYGANDVATAGLNDAITDGGAGAKIEIGSNVGAMTIASFFADPTGVIDLLNNAGGYASASAAWGALVDDGHGDSTLSLGADGSLEFLGMTKEKLSAASIKIG